MTKPILCLDFDGVIHSYTSPWTIPSDIPDPPTPGAMDFLWEAHRYFRLVIYSSRSISNDGLWSMKLWMAKYLREAGYSNLLDEIEWASKKPAAFITIDDRAMCFVGLWPDPQELLKFKPWNRT